MSLEKFIVNQKKDLKPSHYIFENRVLDEC